MTTREIEEALQFEKEIQDDLNNSLIEEETGEENWKEYLRKQQEEEEQEYDIMDYFDDNYWGDDDF